VQNKQRFLPSTLVVLHDYHSKVSCPCCKYHRTPTGVGGTNDTSLGIIFEINHEILPQEKIWKFVSNLTFQNPLLQIEGYLMKSGKGLENSHPVKKMYHFAHSYSSDTSYQVL
jgi:hypothetical protein